MEMSVRCDKRVHRHRAAGFSLLELSAVLAILSVLASYHYPALQRHLEMRAVEQTSAGVRLVAELAISYYQQHQRWPTDFQTLGRALGLEHSLVNRNGFGYPYALEIFMEQLAIVTQVGNHTQAQQLQQLLRPLASVVSTTVTVVVPSPGTESTHLALLPLDGSRSMAGTFNLGGQSIVNVHSLSTTGQAVVNVRNHDGTGRLSADIVEADQFSVVELRAQRFIYEP